MKKTLFIIIGMILLASCNRESKSIIDIAKIVQEEYEKHSSISYDINYKIKYFSRSDTSEVIAKCILIKEPNDSLFGGQIWFNTTDSIEKYYNLTNIYSVNSKENVITEYRPHEGQTWSITGNKAGSLHKIYFFNTEKLTEIVSDSTNQVFLIDTIVGRNKYWILKVNYPDSPPITNISKEIWVSKKLKQINKLSYTVKFQNNYQYNEWELSNIYFDKHDETYLKDMFRTKVDEYEVKQYIEKEKEEIKPLETGVIAPKFSGITYPDKLTFNISDYSGKVILLDFWYVSCFPCIQAIPHLTELYNKFHNQGLELFGLNPTDNNENGLKRLPEFIEYNNLNYPIVFVERDVSDLYKVKVYPTFYIINKEGEVVYSQLGFGESTMPKVDSIIQSELK